MSGNEFCDTNGPSIHMIRFTPAPAPSRQWKSLNKCSDESASEPDDQGATIESNRMIVVLSCVGAGLAYFASFMHFLLGSAGFASTMVVALLLGVTGVWITLGTPVIMFIIISLTPVLLLVGTFVLVFSILHLFAGYFSLLTGLGCSWIFDYLVGSDPPFSGSFDFLQKLIRKSATYAAGFVSGLYRHITDRYNQHMLHTHGATVEVRTIYSGARGPPSLEIHGHAPTVIVCCKAIRRPSHNQLGR